MNLKLVALLLLIIAASFTSSVRSQNGQDKFGGTNQPFKPFNIIANIYYVGTNDIACYLIDTGQGLILIDSGYEESGSIVRSNIETLGFKLSDIKVMLSSHAHFDHVGGHADMKRLTGAKVFASEGDAPVLESGGTKAFFPLTAYKPVKVDHRFKDGEGVTLGSVTMIPRITAGHTEGNTTWTTTVSDGGKPYRVVFVGSMSINPGVHMVNFPAWPTIADVYAKSFQILKGLPCDVFLGPHARFFDMETKVKQIGTSKTNPFIDPAGYQKYIAGFERAYNEQLKQEREAAK